MSEVPNRQPVWSAPGKGDTMRRLILVCGILAVSAWASSLTAQTNPFFGTWDITATTAAGVTYPYWLEVKEEHGKLVGFFQDRWGAVRQLPEIAIEGNELVFSFGAPSKPPGAPKPVHRARVEDGKLVGALTTGAEKVAWVGMRPPKWGKANANATHKLGKPVALFNGKDLAGWRYEFADKPAGWLVVDGTMHNQQTGNNIISEQQFKDFMLVMEYQVEPESNSGLYLRGRYELQVLDDAGKPPSLTGNMAVYGRVAPSANASKPAGEWQTTEVTLVGNRLTVVLNGQKIHDNVEIPGTTGGALNSDEAAPGPIMIQGDHSKVWVRKLVVTPIASGT
jgi:hypothetical protein